MPERTLADALAARRAGICLICGARASNIGDRPSADEREPFEIARCERCGYCFVVNPRTDFENLYTDAYYDGDGLDPLVSYTTDAMPRSVRRYEWSGIVDVVTALLGRRPSRWLDYGCGYGGLVRFVKESGVADEVVGFDLGHPFEHAQAAGVPVIGSETLASSDACFDVITAVEVLEHVIDPLETLEQLANALAPGGVLFITTGNAERHRSAILKWPYLIPEIHVSLYEPRTLEFAYRAVGLTPVPLHRSAAMSRIIKYKILKNLRVKHQSRVIDLLPWRVLTMLADRREGVSMQPAAVRPLSAEPRT